MGSRAALSERRFFSEGIHECQAAICFSISADSPALHLEVKPIYAPPKKFAAAIGFVFSVAISGLLLSGLSTIAIIVAGILAVFATLESVFSICAGCYVYSWVVAPLIEKFKS